MPIVFLNGKFLPEDQALVPVLDRGFVLGDGVYEVIPVYWRRLFRAEQHLERLHNSLALVRMSDPYSVEQWLNIFADLVRFNNGGDDMSLYVQVTRGVAKRDHAIPPGIKPSVFAMCNPIAPPSAAVLDQGIAAITLEDIRWKHCNIKAITLLPNVLMRAEAADQGASDAILVRDGEVSEGTASNVFIVKNNTLLTPPKSGHLLPGVTRDLVLELALQHGIAAREQRLTERDLGDANEIFLSSSTKELLPITKLNGHAVGNGVPGPLWRAMLAHYQAYKHQLREMR